MIRCKDCVFRNSDGRCQNPKLDEDNGQEDRDDMLLYDYSEGGGFWVGPEFGCVHGSSPLAGNNISSPEV